MKLYLVRHAVAYEHGDPAFPNDDDRTLTPKGARQFQIGAAGLLKTFAAPAVLITSPLPRAAQTAAILQAAAGGETRTAICDALRPGGAFDAVLRCVTAEIDAAGPVDEAANPALRHGVALVGHQPSLGLLAAYLLQGDEARFMLPVKKGSVTLLTFEGLPAPAQGELAWSLPPRVLRALAG